MVSVHHSATRRRGIAWLWVTMVVGCGQPSAGPSVVPPPPGQQTSQQVGTDQQRELARAAQKDLFEQLSGRLLAVLSDGGPVQAIEVCSREALELTQRVGQQRSVRLGRTSFRLRNAENAPPAWAADLVRRRVVDPQFVELPEGALGALLPIHLKETCLVCHGPKDQIPDDVRRALAEHYPADQATGFELDALRGWFWIEVPELGGNPETPAR